LLETASARKHKWRRARIQRPESHPFHDARHNQNCNTITEEAPQSPQLLINTMFFDAKHRFVIVTYYPDTPEADAETAPTNPVTRI
jgi:hypothetical protein